MKKPQFIIDLLYIVSKYKKRIQYSKLNNKNFTFADGVFDETRVKIGDYTYGNINCLMNDNNARLIIGSFVSIAPGVTFALSSEHNMNSISTYPFKHVLINGANEALTKGDIIIADDVWIGYNAIILSGVHIGQGAVIAAGAVVSHDVPPYAVVGGVPAKIIKYRFKKEIIDFLMTLDYRKLNEKMIRKNINKLYMPLDRMSIGEIQDLFNWFPKRDL